MTGSAFLPIGSYMLDMPIEGSYRYCRISLLLRRFTAAAAPAIFEWRTIHSEWRQPLRSHSPFAI